MVVVEEEVIDVVSLFFFFFFFGGLMATRTNYNSWEVRGGGCSGILVAGFFCAGNE